MADISYLKTQLTQVKAGSFLFAGSLAKRKDCLCKCNS